MSFEPGCFDVSLVQGSSLFLSRSCHPGRSCCLATPARGRSNGGSPQNDGSQCQNMRKCSNELDDLGNPHFRKPPNRYSKREIMRNNGIQDDLGGAIIFLFETKPYRHFLLLLGLQFGWQNVGSSEACHHWDHVMGLYENWRNPNSNGLKPYVISSEQFLISSCWGISKSICLSYIFWDSQP